MHKKAEGRGFPISHEYPKHGRKLVCPGSLVSGTGRLAGADLTGGPDLDHQWLPQVTVLQLPGLWQEEIRLHADGVQVLKESQFRLFIGREELPVSAVGWQSCWDSKKATI